LRGERADVVQAGEVGAGGADVGAVDGLGRRGELGLVAADERDREALACEPAGDREADPVGRPGDDCVRLG
jgi:hypothetical protein